ncbi:cation diffusion facilitator family transporter [Bacillus fonticola]|uniref:cation diffusion facilitator family transporter n=1 Tax=Bacillus fonticola TaxID=2728853 RepID=UPI00147509EE|nr:cation diffusion facilitator family transporter [Bacillus fonticola]
MDRYQELKMAERGAWVSIGAYIILSAAKLFFGYTFNSEALRADGLNNTTDIVVSIAVLIGLRISQKPADENHRYGHFRAETIASLVASFIIATVGLEVLYNGIVSIVNPKQEAPNLITAWVSLGSAVVMFFVFIYNRNLARRTNSHSLLAAAGDNKSDAYVSIGVFVGIMASQINLAWIDTVAAIIVGLLICKTGWDIFKEATHSLTDGFSERSLEEIKQTIELVSQVEALKDIKARYLGSEVHVDIVIEVSPHLNVQESHEIADEIEEQLHRKHNIAHSNIHTEPANN